MIKRRTCIMCDKETTYRPGRYMRGCSCNKKHYFPLGNGPKDNIFDNVERMVAFMRRQRKLIGKKIKKKPLIMSECGYCGKPTPTSSLIDNACRNCLGGYFEF